MKSDIPPRSRKKHKSKQNVWFKSNTHTHLGVRQTQKVAHAMRVIFQKERETRLHVAVRVRAAKGEVVQKGEGAAKTESEGGRGAGGRSQMEATNGHEK